MLIRFSKILFDGHISVNFMQDISCCEVSCKFYARHIYLIDKNNTIYVNVCPNSSQNAGKPD